MRKETRGKGEGRKDERVTQDSRLPMLIVLRPYVRHGGAGHNRITAKLTYFKHGPALITMS